MTLETERAVLLRYTRAGGWRRGSGLRIGGTLVLTAEHCAQGSDHRVVVADNEYPAEVAWRGGRADVDIAILNAPNLPAVTPLAWARVNTAIAARIDGCVALGFPTWNDITPKRRAQADGYVPTGEGAPELLTFKITTPAIREKRVEAGELDKETTPWGGMSGAVIVTGDDQIVGVVRGHAPAAGVGALTFTPLAAIDVLPPETAGGFWRLVGVEDQHALPVLPIPEMAARRPGFVHRDVVELLRALDDAASPFKGPLALRDFRALIVERTRDFVGRQYIFDAVDSYLAGPGLQPSGYVIIAGEPGIGKTSLLAELIRTRGYIHHFNIAAEGVTSTAAFLGNICAQLVIHYQLDHTALPAEATSDAGFMKQLLAEAAEKVHPTRVVVLVDALDEADLPSRTNPLSLPKTLPEGSFFVVTTRKERAYHLLDVDRSEEIELVDDDPRNVDDVRKFVQRFIADHRLEMEKRIADWEKDVDGFTDEIVERGQGNFMYVRQVLNAIHRGELTAANVGGIENLPRGLDKYYAWHWKTMRSTTVARQTWELVVRQLAVAREPISDSKLCTWTGLGKFQVREVLKEWSAFLNSVKVNGETRYRLYHRSFTDWLQALGLEPEENRACDAALAPIRSRDPSLGGSHV
jgi:hypothetical protein